MAESDEERERIHQVRKNNKEKVSGNIGTVMIRVNSLISKLSTFDNFSDLLDNSGYDTLDSKNYFSDFNINKGQGYIDKNFGQYLRI